MKQCILRLTRVSAHPFTTVSPLRERAFSLGFSLIEVLVVIAILATVLAILLPALKSVRESSKTVVCASNLKTVTMEFRYFADGTLEQGRGDSGRLPGTRFWINDFQDRMYGLDEFWDQGSSKTGILNASQELMLCPAGARQLKKHKGLPCGRGAVEPVEDVSVAVNMRLYRAVFEAKGKRLLVSPLATHLSDRILEHSYVPLVLDVNGKESLAKGVDPFYIAPPLIGAGPDDPYASGRYWSPSRRHGGKTVVGFVGGHVLSSSDPHKEKWDWAYQGEVGQ